MGQRGRAWVLANATRRALADKYLRILEELVTGASSQDMERAGEAAVAIAEERKA